MRLIGHLPEESGARTLGDFLLVQGIDNHLEFEKGSGWGIWIKEEDQIEKAAGLLTSYRQNPADPKYSKEAQAAGQLRAAEAKDHDAYLKRLRNRRHLFRPLTSYGFGPLTFVLIAISVVVAIFSKVGMDHGPIMPLFITQFDITEDTIKWLPGLPEIRHGQIWRLFTPMFIHFGPLHILFNMLWLRDLGSMVEGRQSSLQLALLVLVIAAFSNVAQFFIGGVPNFGGMSGVVYGLLGYIWIRGKCDPGSGLYLHQSTVSMMLIWLVLCFTGLVGTIANTAHVTGLLLGMAWGYLSSWRYR